MKVFKVYASHRKHVVKSSTLHDVFVQPGLVKLANIVKPEIESSTKVKKWTFSLTMMGSLVEGQNIGIT